MTEEMKERRRRFLQVAYDLSIDKPVPWVHIQDVARELGEEDPVEVDLGRGEMMNFARYYGNKGLIKNQADGYRLFSLTSQGIDEVEGSNKPQDAGSSTTNTWNIGQAPGANFNTGTQGDIDMSGASYDFRSIEEKIDRFAADPAEAEEFRAVLNEVRRQMEEDGAIKGGVLSQANDKMQNAGWFTGPLAGLMLRFIFGG